jgi:hypothetical protein
VLPGVVQSALRRAVERETAGLLTSVGVAERVLEGAGARAVVAQTTRAAFRQIARGVTVAAGAGAVVDGGLALFHVVPRVRSRDMTALAAAAEVAREAGTGAAATAAGTAAAALLVALTGGLAAPAVFVVAAATSMGAKAGIDWWIAGRQDGGSYARFGASHRSTSRTGTRTA